MELTNHGAVNLAEAIITFACDDITSWIREQYKRGCDYDTPEYTDYMIPTDISERTHKRIRQAKTLEEKKAIYRHYYAVMWYRYRDKKKWAEDAKEFLLGEDGWIEYLTESDGKWIYDKVMGLGVDRPISLSKGKDK